MRFHVVTILAASLIAGTTARAQESALPGLREAAKQAPADVEAQLALGRALIKAGRLPEAETQLRAAARLGRDSIELLYEAMRARFASGNYQKSRAGCYELVKKSPDHVLSQVCMGRAFLVWRRTSRAAEYIAKALQIDPNNFEAELALGDQKRIESAYPEAEAAYQKALTQRPASGEAALGLGLTLALENKLEPAIASLRKAAQLDPNDPEIQFELGQRLQGQEAVALLQKAVAGRPRWPAAELELAAAQLRAGDAKSAEAGFTAYLKHNPNTPLAVAHRAAAYVALGRYAEAEPALKKALELIPNDYETAFALAQLYERTKRYEEAFTQYRSAADLKHESPAPLIAAARLGLALERPVLASALLDKALERAPKSAEALALYGDVLLARGDKKAARDHYQRALAGEGPLDRPRVQKQLTATN